MPGAPWWVERVPTLLAPAGLGLLGLGALWRLSQALERVRENVEPALLRADFLADPRAEPLWAAFLCRELAVRAALQASGQEVAGRIRGGSLGPKAFRLSWEGLGFAANAEDAGTPADDYLDGLFRISRLTEGAPRSQDASPNMASRAERTADFLAVTEPTPRDVLVDLGSGSGKLALTVSASTFSRTIGVELDGSFVAAARSMAAGLGLRNVEFIHGDARELELSRGSIFYLYYPFRGEVARMVAQALGRLARRKAITVYASGPLGGFGEHFLREVAEGALTLCERRGPFNEVLLLRSSRWPG